MGTVPRVFEDKIKRPIRDAMAVDPLITQVGLIEHLNEKFEHSFDFRYIRRLTDKVVGHMRFDLTAPKSSSA
jgi:hypothetical protein